MKLKNVQIYKNKGLPKTLDENATLKVTIEPWFQKEKRTDWTFLQWLELKCQFEFYNPKNGSNKTKMNESWAAKTLSAEHFLIMEKVHKESLTSYLG